MTLPRPADWCVTRTASWSCRRVPGTRASWRMSWCRPMRGCKLCLGGTRQALNARIAAHLLSAGIVSRADASPASGAVAGTAAADPPVRAQETQRHGGSRPDRRTAWPSSPGTSASRLLRQFRDAGYACEQGRFGRLHQLFTENAT